MEDKFIDERRGYEIVLRPVVISVLKGIGLDAFKRTSLFMRNHAAIDAEGDTHDDD